MSKKQVILVFRPAAFKSSGVQFIVCPSGKQDDVHQEWIGKLGDGPADWFVVKSADEALDSLRSELKRRDNKKITDDIWICPKKEMLNIIKLACDGAEVETLEQNDKPPKRGKKGKKNDSDDSGDEKKPKKKKKASSDDEKPKKSGKKAKKESDSDSGSDSD